MAEAAMESRVTKLETHIETERPHLATKADIADVKVWLFSRLLVAMAVQTGILAILIRMP